MLRSVIDKLPEGQRERLEALLLHCDTVEELRKISAEFDGVITDEELDYIERLTLHPPELSDEEVEMVAGDKSPAAVYQQDDDEDL